MKRFITLLASLVLFAGMAQAQPKKKAIQIIYHGHSFFEIRSTKGTTIIMDPHMIEQYGRPKNLNADVALLSHPHNDHTQIGVLKNKTKVKVIRGWKGAGQRADWNIVDEKVKDVRIKSVGVYHDTTQGLEYGKNTVFIVEVDGWRIAHLGDLGHVLTKKQTQKIGEVDVLMIPVGGVYSINGSDAKKVVKQLNPKEYIIPMHYATPIFDGGVFSEEEFIEDHPKRYVAKVRDNKLILNRDADRPRPLITILHWLPKAGK